MAYSPPLSILAIPPALQNHSSRPASFVSGASTYACPPPSSYHHRLGSLYTLRLLSVVTSPVIGSSLQSDATTPYDHTLSATVMADTATSSQIPPKKPGFFRRMSLSTSQNKAIVDSEVNGNARASPHKIRSVSGSVTKGDVVAGPSYDSLPVRVPTHNDMTMQNRGFMARSSTAQPIPKSIARPSSDRTASTPIASAFTAPKPNQRQSPESSSPRSRYPIHPALASPPTSPPRRMSATAPYNAIEPKFSPAKTTTLRTDGRSGGDFQARDKSGQTDAQPRIVKNIPLERPQQQHKPQTTTLPNQIPNPSQTGNRPKPAPLSIPNTSPRISSRSVPQRDSARRHSRFEDADAVVPANLPEGAQASAYAQTSRPEAREMVSARRSISSSRRAPTAKIEKRSIPAPTAPVETTNSPMIDTAATQVRQEKGQLTEASAYAKSIAATLGTRDKSSTTPAAVKPQSRPLPTPPGGLARSFSKNNVIVIASISKDHAAAKKLPRAPDTRLSDVYPTTHPASPPQHTTPLRNKRVSSQPLNFDFPRSPTLPPLVDPRTVKTSDPIAQWSKAPGSPITSDRTQPLATAQLPPRMHSRRAVSSPLASPTVGTAVHPFSPVVQSPLNSPRAVTAQRPFNERPKATITFLMVHARIQAALLNQLSINSFLSLIGASNVIRKRFTGETVGRWVMKEWSIQVDRDQKRAWPNLTVWEGFLESLLHDPITYSTYSPEWHHLLQHLSLSHTLIVLNLRQLPATAFPNPPPLPFEDEFAITMPNLPSSSSNNNFGGQRPRSRLGSAAGSDAGSMRSGTKMPRQERLVEIVMPEPLAGQSTKEDGLEPLLQTQKARRRGSIGSIASATSLSFGRRRSSSLYTDNRFDMSPVSPAAPMPTGKTSLPPVSYPAAKRYGFKRHGEPARSRKSSESSRPGSIFSVQSTPSIQRVSSIYSGRHSFAVDRNAPPVPGLPPSLPMPPPIGGGNRSSFDAGRANRSGGNSPVSGIFASRRDLNTPLFTKAEPAFDRPIPFTVGRVPILRVFVPLSERVPRWPSAEGAVASVKELEKCGALKKMQLGDLVILYLDLAPFAQQAMQSIRLAYDRRDVTVSSGARLSAKRYLHVAGFEIRPQDRAAPEWRGMVSLEAEGTAEGKQDIERRLVGVNGGRPIMGPWEVVREKSMIGTVWLRLIK
ncbi:uncharacterized protein L201_007366 [Kwoniella dendrophila CBS 6074]|uniref:Uncharacterized protein n=1 Tax=Kwoniella dendrophila CBS 6074 TaxID=1295534 RepID=A0AAX4K5K6_9TREE